MTEYHGARWIRADLHLHSPAVRGFRKPAGLDSQEAKGREALVRQYVDQLKAEGIELAAITDYNSVREEWFQPLQSVAGEAGIVVLPGAELSFRAGKYGLHILALFPSDADLRAVNRAIAALDNEPAKPLLDGSGKHREIEPAKRIEDLLRDLRRQFSCLLVLAHASEDKGLFRTFDGQAAARFVLEVRPDAIEGFNDADRKRLVDTNLIEADACERVPCVEFSDPKSLSEIGTKERAGGLRRATFLKLSDVHDIAAVRLALQDASVRVTLGERPSATNTRLVSVEIEGSGFLQELSAELSPDLNVLIGGRGVGKSALLETIRYTLGIEPYDPTDYRGELVRYALGSGGKAVIHLTQAVSTDIHRVFRIERVWGEAPRVFELNPEREVGLMPLDVLAESGPPLFFGQREIYEITRSREQRLRLIDEIIGRAAKQKQLDVQGIENDLRANARQLLELETKLAGKADAEQRLKELEHEIELYKREGLAEKLRNSTLLAHDEELMREARESVVELQDDVAEQHSGTLERLSEAASIGVEAASPQANLLQEAAAAITRASQALSEVYASEAKVLKALLSELDAIAKRWTKARRPLDLAIEKVKKELGPSPLDPDHLDKLTREKARLGTKLRSLRKSEKDRAALRRDRAGLLRALRSERHEVFRLRQKQAQELSSRLHGRVRVHVEYKGQTMEFADRLAGLFQGSRVDKKSIERLCAVEGRVVDGLDIADALRKGVEEVGEVFGLTAPRASQIFTWMGDHPERMFDLELLSPTDLVEVYLRLDDDRERPLPQLSDGQRATAMLLLLLAQVDRLLIVDQPEDDLDNRFIYEDVVRDLREQKGRRQCIVATHNPNIPVLGDAEWIAALESAEGRGFIVDQGSLDRESVRNLVKRIMEGGEDAFRLRAEKYGWSGL